MCAICDGCGHLERTDIYPDTWPAYKETADATEQRYCSRSCLIVSIRGPVPWSVRTDMFGIGPREVHLLKLLADGLSNGEIAQSTGKAISTVKNQLYVLYRKLGAADRTQAILVAHAQGVINLNVQTDQIRSAQLDK